MILDIVVVIAYCIGMLSLGWYGMKRARTREEFLVAGRHLGPAFYMGTMATTVLGGASTVGTVRLGYVYGLSGAWLCAALGLGIVVLNLFLAKPLLRLKIVTVTQVLERRYSPRSRHFSALVMLAYALMLSATSVIAIGTVLQVLFDMPRWLAILAGGGVIVVYSAIGGMWSLTLTDIVQFLIKTVGLVCVLLPLCWHAAGGWDALVAQLPATQFDPMAIGWGAIATYFVIYFFGILLGQDIWQRVFTARSAAVAQVAGTAAGVYCVIYGVALALVGVTARALLPDLPDANTAFVAIVQASLPDGLRGLMIAAALAAMMSTASAAVLAASTTLSEDLLPWLGRGHTVATVRGNRYCTLWMGVLVLVIALMVQDVLSALTCAYNLLVGGMLIPLLGAIYWKRGTTQGAIVSMMLGCAASIATMVVDGLSSNWAIYTGLAASLTGFVLVSMMGRRERPPVME